MASYTNRNVSENELLVICDTANCKDIKKWAENGKQKIECTPFTCSIILPREKIDEIKIAFKDQIELLIFLK